MKLLNPALLAPRYVLPKFPSYNRFRLIYIRFESHPQLYANRPFVFSYLKDHSTLFHKIYKRIHSLRQI